MHTWNYACYRRNAEMSDIRKIVSEIFFFKTKGVWGLSQFIKGKILNYNFIEMRFELSPSRIKI